MIAGERRSEQVIEAYQRHKLGVSALTHIRRILRDFERERETDRRLARYGVGIIVAMLAFAVLSRLGVERILLP